MPPTPAELTPTTPPDAEAHGAARAEARRRQANKTVRADLAGKAIGIAVRLLVIPLSVQLLGAERYGLWLTLNSVMMWLNLSQFGLGGGLLNEIGKASATGDRVRMRRHVSSAYALFTGIAVVVFALVFLAANSPLAPGLLGVAKAPHLADEARQVFLLAGGLFALSLVTNAVGSVCMGLQEGYLSYVTYAAGSLLSLVGLGVVLWSGTSSMVAFAVAMNGPVLAMNLVLSAYVFLRRHPELRPRWADLDRANIKSLLSMSGALGVVQLGELTVLHAASPLIANTFGLGQVPQYAVPMSFFMMVATVCQGLMTAYLAAFCEASVRLDWAWIRATFEKTRRRGLLLIVAFSAGMTVAGPFGLSLWTRGKVTPDMGLLAAMGVYFTLMVLSMQCSVLLVGLGKAHAKALLQVGVAVIHIGGFFVLAPSLGLVALPAAGSAAFVLDIVAATYLARQTMTGEAA